VTLNVIAIIESKLESGFEFIGWIFRKRRATPVQHKIARIL